MRFGGRSTCEHCDFFRISFDRVEDRNGNACSFKATDNRSDKSKANKTAIGHNQDPWAKSGGCHSANLGGLSSAKQDQRRGCEREWWHVASWFLFRAGS
jgi:hypothetical protein